MFDGLSFFIVSPFGKAKKHESQPRIYPSGTMSRIRTDYLKQISENL